MEETNDYLNKVGSFDGDTSFKDIKKFVKGEVEDHEQVLEDACEDCEDGTRVSSGSILFIKPFLIFDSMISCTTWDQSRELRQFIICKMHSNFNLKF